MFLEIILGICFNLSLLSLEDFEGRMNAAIERNAFLESELDEKVHNNKKVLFPLKTLSCRRIWKWQCRGWKMRQEIWGLSWKSSILKWWVKQIFIVDIDQVKQIHVDVIQWLVKQMHNIDHQKKMWIQNSAVTLKQTVKLPAPPSTGSSSLTNFDIYLELTRKFIEKSSSFSLKMRSQTMTDRWRSCNRIAIRRWVWSMVTMMVVVMKLVNQSVIDVIWCVWS